MPLLRKNGRKILGHIVPLVIFTIFQAGCSPRLYHVDVTEGSKVSSIKTIGVWRGRPHGHSTGSVSIVTRAFEDSFRAAGFTVIEHDELSKVASLDIRHGIESFLRNLNVPAEALESLSREAGVDALFLTSISNVGCDAFREQFDSCILTVSIRLIDTRSGTDIMTGNLWEEEFSLRVAARKIAERAVRELRNER